MYKLFGAVISQPLDFSVESPEISGSNERLPKKEAENRQNSAKNGDKHANFTCKVSALGPKKSPIAQKIGKAPPTTQFLQVKFACLYQFFARLRILAFSGYFRYLMDRGVEATCREYVLGSLFRALGTLPSSTALSSLPKVFGKFMSTELQVVVNSQIMNVVIPEHLATVAVLLPIVTRLFSTQKHTVVNAKDVFSKLGGTYRFKGWLEHVAKDCRLEKGVDYFEELLDHSDPANFQAMAANRGVAPVYTYFTLKAARKITLRSKADDAHIFFEFVDAVLEAIVPSLLSKLTLANQETARQRNLADRNEQVALQAVKKVDGRLNISQFEMAEQVKSRLGITRAQMAEANQAALTLWEYSTKARRALAASKPQEAADALRYLDALYGGYSDMLRDEPPWAYSKP